MQRKLLILGFLCCSLTGFAQNNKKTHAIKQDTSSQTSITIDYKKTGSPMPEILLISPDLNKTPPPQAKKKAQPVNNQITTGKELDNQANLLVMMFNPTCGHCEDQTELFKKNIFLFKKTKLVLMAGAVMLPYLGQFNDNLQVTEFPATMIMGVDSSKFIDKTFLYEGLPQLNIYDHERKLIRSFTGLIPIDSLKQYIE